MNKLAVGYQINCFPLNYHGFIFMAGNKLYVVNNNLQILLTINILYRLSGQSSYFTFKLLKGKLYTEDGQNLIIWTISTDTYTIPSNKYIHVIHDKLIVEQFGAESEFQTIEGDHLVKSNEIKEGGYITSWCGLGVRMNFQDQITVINPDFTETVVYETTTSHNCYYFQGGLCIAHCGDIKKYMVIDALNKRVYFTTLITSVTSTQFHFCKYGQCLEDRMILKIMGKQNCGEFLKSLETYYGNWRREQMLILEFPMQNLLNLLREANIDTNAEEVVGFPRFKIRAELNQMKIQIDVNYKNIIELQLQIQEKQQVIKQIIEKKLAIIKIVENLI